MHASANAIKLSESAKESPARLVSRGRKSNGPTSKGESGVKSTLLPYFATLSGFALCLGPCCSMAPYSYVPSLFHSIYCHSGHQRDTLSAFPASLEYRLRKVQNKEDDEVGRVWSGKSTWTKFH